MLLTRTPTARSTLNAYRLACLPVCLSDCSVKTDPPIARYTFRSTEWPIVRSTIRSINRSVIRLDIPSTIRSTFRSNIGRSFGRQTRRSFRGSFCGPSSRSLRRSYRIRTNQSFRPYIGRRHRARVRGTGGPDSVPLRFPSSLFLASFLSPPLLRKVASLPPIPLLIIIRTYVTKTTKQESTNARNQHARNYYS